MPKYTLNTDKMFADVTDNIAIIIDSETGIYYGMNTFATNIYENLINNNIPSEIILESIKTLITDNINNANNNAKTTTNNTNDSSAANTIDSIDSINNIEQSFNSFLNFLIQNEIIVELEQYSNERQNLNDVTNQPDQEIKEISLNIQKTTQNIKTPDLNIQLAINDNFKIIIKEYNDAQELLLADPIHEVNQETGWSPEKSSLNNNH